MPGIMCYDDAPVAGIRTFFYDKISDPLGRAANGKSVHPVGPGAYLSPKPRCPEAHVLVEAVPDLCFIVFYRKKLFV